MLTLRIPLDTCSGRLSLCALVERTCRRKVLFKDDCQVVNNAFFLVRNAAVRMTGLVLMLNNHRTGWVWQLHKYGI